jgi:hypothetical protein
MPKGSRQARCPDCQAASAAQANRENGRRNADRRKQERAEARASAPVCSAEDCTVRLRRGNLTGRCKDHPRVGDGEGRCPVDGCGKKLRVDNSTGFCRGHQSVTSRFPPRICASDGCTEPLRVTNKSGYCFRHVAETPNAVARNEMLRAQRAEHRAEWPVCSFEGCGQRLRSDNKTGRCRDHTTTAIRPECPVEGCTNRLIASNRVGRCEEHRDAYWVAPICGAVGCGRILNADNKTGRCRKHRSDYNRTSHLMREYGITLEQHDAMLTAQSGLCAICGSPPDPDGYKASRSLHVDHNHETKQVRALLCLNCNRGLGHYFDNPELLRKAADYLEFYASLPAAEGPAVVTLF